MVARARRREIRSFESEAEQSVHQVRAATTSRCLHPNYVFLAFGLNETPSRIAIFMIV
jgi:hypothetical protein